MERITVSLYEEISEKINQRAKAKRLKPAAYTRQLIELGLRIEEMSEQKNEDQNKEDPIEKALTSLKKLVEKEFLASQESLYLVRYLLANSNEKNSGDNKKMLEQAKLKSQSVLEVYQEEMA